MSRPWSASAASTSSAWWWPHGWRAVEPVYPNLPRGAVRRALEALRDAAIIESKGRADWRFTSPLLRRYLISLEPFA